MVKGKATGKPKTLAGFRRALSANSGTKKATSSKSLKNHVVLEKGTSSHPVRETLLRGEAALKQNMRTARRLAIQEEQTDVTNLGAAITNSTLGETSEAILCYVNPQILFQIVWATIMKPLSASSHIDDLRSALSTVREIITNFEQLPDNFNDVPLPKAIVELRAALEPRRIGRYSYAADWSPLREFNAHVVANGFIGTNVGQVLPYPDGTFTNDFGNVTAIAPALNPDTMASWLAGYPSFFDLTPYSKWIDDRGDASAFAHDPAGGSKSAGIPSGKTIAYIIGFDGNSAYLYARQNGLAALETKINRPHLASYRVCTAACQWLSGGTSRNTSNTRLPIHTISPMCTPSVAAWNHARKIAGIVQLKPVPVTQTGRDVKNKIEATVQIQDTTATNPLYAKWLSTFSAGDWKLFCSQILKLHSLNYCGAYVGTVLMSTNSSGVVTTDAPMLPEYHVGIFELSNMRLPEMLMRALGSQQPYSDKYGTLIPWRSDVNPTNITPNLIPDSGGGGYTGTGIVTANIPANEWSYSMYRNWNPFVQKYRYLEPYLANRANMNLQAKRGPSMLDITFLQDPVTSFLTAAHSRRKITQFDLDVMYSNGAWITYDTGDRHYFNSKEYQQFNRFDCAGYTIPSSHSINAIYDGAVTNGFTSNESDATGSAHSGGDNSFAGFVHGTEAEFASGMLQKPAIKQIADYPANSPPHPLQAPLTRRIQQLVTPTWGNYCGPGWTAGEKTLDHNPIMKDGRYLVEPTDKEDAACKRHDEGYYHAKGDKNRERLADERFVQDLKSLEADGLLSVFGRMAKYYFRVPPAGDKEDRL